MPRRSAAARALAAIAVVACVACGDRPELPPAAIEAAADIDAQRIGAAMRELGADAMEGRAAGSPGYDRAAGWVVERLAAIGVAPAGEHGSYFQQVPLLASTLVTAETSLRWERDGERVAWAVGRDVIVSADSLRVRAELSAPLVFAGYGVHAPDQGHDDWDGLDVEGAVVAIFRGAPASFSPPLRALHADRTLTRRLAVERGAVGILWLLTPQAQTGQPWERRLRQASRGSMDRIGADGRPVGVHEEIAIEALLSDDTARSLLRSAGLDLDETVVELDAGTTRSRALPGRLIARTASEHRRLESPNVVGRIEGSGAELASEHVVLTAHLDHLGIGEPEDGDAIYNGTYDNASGVAIMLEVARVIASAETRPARSILILAVTAEERGLLGSAHWVEEPTVPLDGVVANVNLDMVLMLHPLRDVIAYGAQHSSLAPLVEAAAAEVGVAVAPDPFPDETIFLRSDQMSFVRRGIPALFLWSGVHDGASRDAGAARWREWMRDTYHSPRDDDDQPIDLEAGAAMARLDLLVTWGVADADRRPEWIEGDVVAERFARPAP